MIVLAAAELGLGCAGAGATASSRTEPPAPATSADALAKARADFDEALARQTAGDWVGALSLLRKVEEARSTPQVRFNIALCEEFLGRLNAARGHYIQAAQDAKQSHVEDVSAEAERRVAALQERIPTVVLRGPAAAGGVVALDGVELGSVAIDVPVPLDPGAHELTVAQRGKPPARTPFTLAERQRKVIDLAAGR